MLATLMTGLAVWTLASVVLALTAGRVITFHERSERLQPLAETVRGCLGPIAVPMPIREM
jgi:hypothetical protein